MDPRVFVLFELYCDEEIIKCFFVYMTEIFTDMEDTSNARKRDDQLENQANLSDESKDFENLIRLFWNSIYIFKNTSHPVENELGRNFKLVKMIEQKARKNQQWSVLFDKLQLKTV